MREEIYRFLSPPERGTPRYRVIITVKKITALLLLVMAILLIARVCSGFNPADGSTMDDYFVTVFSLLFAARYIIGPVVWLLKKLAGIGRKERQDI